MSFASYKYQKAIGDYRRIHDVMYEASEAARGISSVELCSVARFRQWIRGLTSKEARHDAKVKSHSAFKALPDTLEKVRRVADDLLSDVGNAWDYFLNDALAQFNVPTSGPKPNGANGGYSLNERLTAFSSIDPTLADYLSKAKDHLFQRLKDARNAYQHSDFWKNTFQVSFPGDGPFLMELRWNTTSGEIAVMRDTRRGIHVLHQLNLAFGSNHDFPPPQDPCDECYQDSWLLPGQILDRLDQI